MRRKGFALTLDAVISLMFVTALLLGMHAYRFTSTSETSTSAFINLHYISEDALDVLNKQGILDNISEEWTSGNKSLAGNLSMQYLDLLVPPHIGYRLVFDGVTVTENTMALESSAMVKTNSMRLLAGFTENRTSQASVARAYLTGITQKSSSAYAYFGGFVGQGDITRYLYVPVGVMVTNAYMEMDAGSAFNLQVNGQACPVPSPSGGYLSANIEADISACAFTPGQNTLRISFTSANSSQHFIGGGFVRVGYNTSIMDESAPAPSGTYEFPGIEGFINYFSSFYVPGQINSMSAYLEFDNEYTTFLKVGDVLVYNSTGSPLTQKVSLDNAYLSSILNYNSLSSATIPLRLGTSDISEIIQQGNADVVLITDLSGSMAYPMGAESGTGVIRGCSDPLLYDDDTRRVSVAKCLDRRFVEIILEEQGNRVGLVSFSSSVLGVHSLSDDESSLLAEINSYPDSPSGGTCICCAINQAYEMLESSPDKHKFIIVMSDGITGYCCGSTRRPWPWWWLTQCNPQGTSTSGQYNDCGGGPSDCSGAQCDGAIANAIWSSAHAYSQLDAIVHSVGFGPVDDCENANYTLTRIAEEGNGSYCYSADPAALEDCYVRFAEDIVEASISSQIVNLSGSVTPSTLYPNSHISYEYTPIASPLAYGDITLSYDTPRFNDAVSCEGIFYLPESVEAIEATATSYSSEHWTHHLQLQNSGGARVLFRLGDYGSDYFTLGDPFLLNIRADYLKSGENNTVKIMTADTPLNETGCSPDNRAILMVKMKGSVPYGNTFDRASGCNWLIEFQDGTSLDGPIPSTYSGIDTCEYSSSSHDGGYEDAVKDATYRLLRSLDWEGDGRLDIKFDAAQIGMETTSIGGVRSLWGPAKLKLELWL
jgi:hypothetical protein